MTGGTREDAVGVPRPIADGTEIAVGNDAIDEISSPAQTFQQASADADRAAVRAAGAVGVRADVLHDPELCRAASEVLQQVWADPVGSPLRPEVLRALSHSGNYVGIVFDDATIVGVACGFRTDRDELHSHIAGVLPGYQHRSIGYVLKLHQRAWALRQGIPTITWTFDPIIRRNAHFNLIKLGAQIAEYVPDFYGTLTGQAAGDDHSDRLLVRWDLLAGVPGDPVEVGGDVTSVLAIGKQREPVLTLSACDRGTISLPPDFEQLRRGQPELVMRWRHALRTALADVFERGHLIIGMDAQGAYATRMEQ